MIGPIDIINCISAFQLFIFILYIFHNGKNKLPNTILGIFFIAQFLVIGSYACVNVFKSYNEFMAQVQYALIPLCFVWGPLMYFYVTSQINKQFKFRIVHLLHFLPTIFLFVLIVVAYYSADKNLIIIIIKNGLFIKKLIFINMLMNLQVITYNILSLTILLKYQREIKNFSSSSEKTNFIWLKTVLYGYIIACFITELIFFSGDKFPINYELKQIIVYSVFLIFFNVLFYKAIINPFIFIEIEEKMKQPSIAINNDTLKKLIARLEDYIIAEKPYLNPNLTLKELSDSTGINERVISQIINQHYKKNFYTYINSYRIEEAKQLLTSSNLKNTTMLGIAFDAGFNSKTVFYDAFKKYVGMTPTEFKQMCA